RVLGVEVAAGLLLLEQAHAVFEAARTGRMPVGHHPATLVQAACRQAPIASARRRRLGTALSSWARASAGSSGSTGSSAQKATRSSMAARASAAVCGIVGTALGADRMATAGIGRSPGPRATPEWCALAR